MSYHNNNGPFTVKQIADIIGCEYKGNGNLKLVGINAIEKAKADELAFLDNSKYVKYLSQTKAGAVIVKEELVEHLNSGVVAILSQNPHSDYAKVSNAFYASAKQTGFISDSAKIHKTVIIGENVVIEPNVVILEGVKIGDNTKIEANSYIAKNVEIGANSIIKSNVSIECSKIGNNCLIHAGAKIGQDGFGFAFDPKNILLIKVPQIGGVIIGNYVEIGANTTIDRGSLNDTIIGDMTKIDNLVQIGHNVKIGRMCQIVAQTGIAGSTEIGDGCIFGGQSGIAGHLKIADRVMLASRAGVSKSISKVGEVLGGYPAVPIMQWRKSHAVLMRLIKKAK